MCHDNEKIVTFKSKHVAFKLNFISDPFHCTLRTINMIKMKNDSLDDNSVVQSLGKAHKLFLV